MKPGKKSKRQSAAYKSGYQDGNTGGKSKIDPANNQHAAHQASTDYLTGYAVGKQALDARGGKP